MSDHATGPRTVGDYLAILQAKRTKLLADIAAAEKGLRGGGRPRGFQAEGRTDEEAARRGAAWVQGRVDADFHLPALRWLHQDLNRLDVGNLPPWTDEPQDETAALDLLNRMIRACEQTASSEPPLAGSTATPLPLRASAKDLAAMLGESDDAVDSFLRRYRDKYPDCYIPTDSPRRNEPKYLYRVADVLPALKQHFAK
jgi:hypothetical protein